MFSKVLGLALASLMSSTDTITGLRKSIAAESAIANEKGFISKIPRYVQSIYESNNIKSMPDLQLTKLPHDVRVLNETTDLKSVICNIAVAYTKR